MFSANDNSIDERYMKYISIAYSEKKKVNKPQKVYDKFFLFKLL